MGSTADDEGRPAGNPGRCTAVHPPIGASSEGASSEGASSEGGAAAAPEPARDVVPTPANISIKTAETSAIRV